MLLSWNELNPSVTHANLLHCSASFKFGPRFIQEHQFIYVASGKGTAQIGSQLYDAEAGHLFYYGPHVPHWFQADHNMPFTLYGVHFTLSGELPDPYRLTPVIIQECDSMPETHRINELLIGTPDQRLTVPELLRECTWAKSIFAEMAADFERCDEISFQYNRARMLMFLLRLQEHLLPAATKQADAMKRVLNQLAEHAEEPYDRAWLKEWTHYHEDHAARLFSQTYGISPHQYHLRQKIQCAKRYLMSTDLSISEITDKIQLGTIHYFSRMFKQHTGLSPTAYRKRTRTI